jgi:hypothetical protein
MKQLKIILAVALIFFGRASVAQQQRLHLALSYNTATPVSSSFKDYVSKTSFRGFQGAVLYNINTSLRVGLQVSWNDLYEKYGRQVYKNEDGSDVSAVLSNTLQFAPVLVKGEYSFIKEGWLQPYVGLGAGISLINVNQYVGEFLYQQSYAKAAFSGDVGLLIPFSKGSSYGGRISTSYTLSPFNKEGIKTIDTWNVQAGVVIPLK